MARDGNSLEKSTVTEIGYALSSEEHPPDALVRNAQAAEAAGFTFALISNTGDLARESRLNPVK
jgi:hypothetical protein